MRMCMHRFTYMHAYMRRIYVGMLRCMCITYIHKHVSIIQLLLLSIDFGQMPMFAHVRMCACIYACVRVSACVRVRTLEHV